MLVAAPNLTTDRTLTIEELRPGEVLRFSTAEVTPGGKGVNVVRVARAMGFPATLVALVPGRTGAAVAGLLADEGLDVVAVPIEGEVRAASIVLEASGRVTVLNEPGPPITSERWHAYERAVAEHVPRHRFLVCIGSAPPGTPDDGYARLVDLARGQNVRAVVDAAGPLLRSALQSGPDIVTPNLGEAEEVLLDRSGQPVDEASPDARGRALDAASGLVDRGARSAVVTAGRLGLAVATGGGRRWVDAPEVEVRNPIGAGDALVAGLAGSLEQDRDVREALAVGVACAAASVEQMAPGVVDPDRVRSLVSSNLA
jgi:1-phosphofructokinase family hexose kinase